MNALEFSEKFNEKLDHFEMKLLWRRRDQSIIDSPSDIQASIDNAVVQAPAVSLAGGREEQVQKEVVRLAKGLSDLVMRTTFAKVDSVLSTEMKRIAATILGILGVELSGTSLVGRAFAADLRVGGIYTAKGWPEGEFDWTFLGMVAGDESKMSIRRNNKEPSVEELGDHGLAPYGKDAAGTIWHTSNWTEGTGLSEELVMQVTKSIKDSVSGGEPMEFLKDDNEIF
jgi:hypothetical protein